MAKVSAAETRAKVAEAKVVELDKKVKELEEKKHKATAEAGTGTETGTETSSKKPVIAVKGSSTVLFDFKNVVQLLEKEKHPAITKTVKDPNFKKTFEDFCREQEKTIQENKELHNSIEDQTKLDEMITDDKFNKMAIYHNLSVEKSGEQTIKIMETDLEEGKKTDFVQVSYKKEKVHDRVSKNIVTIDAVKSIDEGEELDDKACLVMALSARDLAKKTKKFVIDNCEQMPLTAIKLFLFGKALGLAPSMNDATKAAIANYNTSEQLLMSLKDCYNKVIQDPKFSSEEVLKIIKESSVTHDLSKGPSSPSGAGR